MGRAGVREFGKGSHMLSSHVDEDEDEDEDEGVLRGTCANLQGADEKRPT